jgi:hypothetical protein
MSATPDVEASGELAEQVANFYAGAPGGPALVAAFREALLFVPLGDGTALLTADGGGLRWLYAFTSSTELARYAAAREEADREWHYVTVRGARMLEQFLPGLPQPCGVVLDVAGERPMTFPPVRGVVPHAIAVNATGPSIKEGPAWPATT